VWNARKRADPSNVRFSVLKRPVCIFQPKYRQFTEHKKHYRTFGIGPRSGLGLHLFQRSPLLPIASGDCGDPGFGRVVRGFGGGLEFGVERRWPGRRAGWIRCRSPRLGGRQVVAQARGWSVRLFGWWRTGKVFNIRRSAGFFGFSVGGLRVEVADGVGDPGGAPLPALKRPPIRPLGVRSLTGRSWLVVAACAVQSLFFGCSVGYFWILRTFGDGQLVVSAEERRAALFASMVVWGVLVAVVYAFELIAFLVWQARALENVAGLGSGGMRFSSSTAWIWWFVPVAVLWKPIFVVQEIWRGSDPGVAAGDGLAWRLRGGSVLAGIWWALLVGAKVLYWVGPTMAILSMTSLLGPLELWIIALGVTAVASLLQIPLVLRVSKRQAALEAKRLKAVAKAEAAGEPVIDADETPEPVTRRTREVVVGPAAPGASAADEPLAEVPLEADKLELVATEGVATAVPEHSSEASDESELLLDAADEYLQAESTGESSPTAVVNVPGLEKPQAESGGAVGDGSGPAHRPN